MKFRIVTGLVLFLSMRPSFGQDPNKLTAVLNQVWLKSLVSIEVVQDPNREKPIGTGFLVGTPNEHLALVTAKHVVFSDKGKGPLIANLAYRLNDKQGSTRLILDVAASRFVQSSWVKSHKFDVACRLIVRGKTWDHASIPYSAFLPVKRLQAGAPLYIFGFPMGIRSKEYATPIVRRAIVALPDPNNIIVDGFVFPGNSGGPVIYSPSVRFGKGFDTPILQQTRLVGLVLASINYTDVAISQQTGRPRITFEDNSGLSNVLPSDRILELLESPEFVQIDSKVLK